MMSLPKIFLVDDHQIFRTSMKSLIVNEKIGNVIGEASNGQEFLDRVESAMPDLVLMDIDMPIMGGAEATALALAKHPNMNVLALSMFGDASHYYTMVKAGVKGFLLKSCDISELESAIQKVVKGENYFSNELLRNIISEFGTGTKSPEAESAHLTERELAVLKLICSGFTNDEIAKELFISDKTVKGHRANLLDKTSSKNTPSMIIYAIKHKIIEI